MYLGALACLVSFALVLLLYRDPPDMPAEPLARLLARSDAARMADCLGRGACLGLSIRRLHRAGELRAGGVHAARLFALPTQATSQPDRLVFILAIPLWSIVAERLQRPNLMMSAAFIVSALALAALPFAAAPLVPLAVLVVVPGAVPGLIMALPAQALRAKSRAGGMGVYFTVYYVADGAGAGRRRARARRFGQLRGVQPCSPPRVMLLCVHRLDVVPCGKADPGTIRGSAPWKVRSTTSSSARVRLGACSPIG